MPTATVTKISEESQELLVNYVNICFERFRIETARTRYERIDKALQLEDTERRKEIEHYYDDIVMPAAKAPVRKIGNFLIDIFVSKATPFEVVSSKVENAPAVKQFNTVLEENAKTSKWNRELVLFFKDLPKYNIGVISAEWVTHGLSLVSNSPDITSSASKVTAATRSGNVLKRWDLYNTFYDTTVDPSQVTDRGDFAGYVERFTATRLHKYLSDLKLSIGVATLLNEDKIFTSQGTATSNRYYTPNVATANSVTTEPTNMELLFSGARGTAPLASGSKDAQMDPAGMYEVAFVYVRIVPSIFKMKEPGEDEVCIYKLHLLNWNLLIAVERVTNAHNVFPVVFCQIDEEGIGDQVKSAAELLLPLQNLQTKYYDARVKGLNRSVNDRALYDQSRIDKKHMDDNNPSSKIPVRPNLLNPSIAGAYQQIPFQDNLASTMLNEVSFLDKVAQRTSGINDPQQGMFQKGNKTLGEFNEVMANADDDLRTWAKLVESQALSTLKYIIKINTMQYQASTAITTAGEEGTVDVNPMQLRAAAMDFKVADGLISKDTILDMPTARSFFELLLQSPQLQQYYGEKLPQMVDYIFTSVGFDTSQFKSGTNPQALNAPQQPAAPAAQPTE